MFESYGCVVLAIGVSPVSGLALPYSVLWVHFYQSWNHTLGATLYTLIQCSPELGFYIHCAARNQSPRELSRDVKNLQKNLLVPW